MPPLQERHASLLTCMSDRSSGEGWAQPQGMLRALQVSKQPAFCYQNVKQADIVSDVLGKTGTDGIPHLAVMVPAGATSTSIPCT